MRASPVSERASLAAQGRRIETEATLIRYVAELVGARTDSERAIQWLIPLMVLCCDPLAIALTAAACQCPAVYRLPDQARRPYLNLKFSRLRSATDRQPINFKSRSISEQRFLRTLSTPSCPAAAKAYK